MSRADDALERQADGIAARVSRGEHGPFSLGEAPAAVMRAPAARRLSTPAPLRAGVASPGRPLDAGIRRTMESRFGSEFGNVRVHDGAEASRSAAAVNARAYAHGSDIVFGAGQYLPGTAAFERLLAHELVHVLQRRADMPLWPGLVQRAPLEEEEEEEESVADGYQDTVHLAVSTDSEATGTFTGVTLFARIADLSGWALYEGDVFNLSIALGAGGAGEPEVVGLPAELELVGPAKGQTIALRVKTGPGRGDAPNVLSLMVRFGPSQQDTQVVLQVDPLPDRVDVTDPALEQSSWERGVVQGERRRTRADFRKLPRAERRARRGKHAADRRFLRQAARALRREQRDLDRESPCSLEQQQLIETALNRAADVTTRALAVLARVPVQDSRALRALSLYMKLAATAPAADALAVVARVRETLTVARNSILAAGPGSSLCGGKGCDAETGGYVSPHASRSNRVTLCPLFTRFGSLGLHFDVTTSRADARAYALLHEFVHLSGTSGPGEQYVSNDAWTTVSFAQAPEMADAYAAIAWTIGER